MKLLKSTLALLIVISLFIFAGLTNQAKAQMDCQNVSISPSSGTPTSTFTLTASSGCSTNSGYRVIIYDQNNSPIFGTDFPIFASNQQIQPGPSNTFGPFPAGTYRVAFSRWDPPYDTINLSVSVTEGQTNYQCGQQVPLNTPNCSGGNTAGCCPIGCPYDGSALPGQIPVTPRCGCGGEGSLACPVGNPLGLPQCVEGLILNTETNICEPQPTNPGGFLRYYCGETIDPEDLNKASCIERGCPLTAKGDGNFWCACGKSGLSCCPQGEELEDRPNAEPLPACEGTNLSCEAGGLGMCIQPLSSPDMFCANENYLLTAIGCVPVFEFNGFLSFLIRWSVRIAGGIGFLLIIFASLMVITSAGDPKKLQAGKELLTAALAGILMTVFSVFILRIIGVNILQLIF